MGVGDWLKTRVDRFVDARLGNDYHARSRALTVRQNEYGFDQFGFHRDAVKYAVLVARFLYRDYFRCEVHGIENVPAAGRVLLVANHSGQLPFDGLAIATALFLDAQPPRVIRSMVERFVPTVPFASYLFSRWGQITGTPENCRRLLNDEEAILVFPEGARGISKPFAQRYQLQEFGSGFMRLALETRTPIVPASPRSSCTSSSGFWPLVDNPTSTAPGTWRTCATTCSARPASVPASGPCNCSWICFSPSLKPVLIDDDTPATLARPRRISATMAA